MSRGDYVSFATRLGQVGLSGRTQFPHVHLTVRKDGNPIDPFDPDGKITCDAADTNFVDRPHALSARRHAHRWLF